MYAQQLGYTYVSQLPLTMAMTSIRRMCHPYHQTAGFWRRHGVVMGSRSRQFRLYFGGRKKRKGASCSATPQHPQRGRRSSSAAVCPRPPACLQSETAPPCRRTPCPPAPPAAVPGRSCAGCCRTGCRAGAAAAAGGQRRTLLHRRWQTRCQWSRPAGWRPEQKITVAAAQHSTAEHNTAVAAARDTRLRLRSGLKSVHEQVLISVARSVSSLQAHLLGEFR